MSIKWNGRNIASRRVATRKPKFMSPHRNPARSHLYLPGSGRKYVS